MHNPVNIKAIAVCKASGECAPGQEIFGRFERQVLHNSPIVIHEVFAPGFVRFAAMEKRLLTTTPPDVSGFGPRYILDPALIVGALGYITHNDDDIKNTISDFVVREDRIREVHEIIVEFTRLLFDVRKSGEFPGEALEFIARE